VDAAFEFVEAAELRGERLFGFWGIVHGVGKKRAHYTMVPTHRTMAKEICF
jgi:hypothetical protein